MKRLSLWLSVAVVLAAGAAVLSLNQSYRGFEGEIFVKIERGTSTAGVASALAQGGVIRYPWQLWLERAFRPSANLQAGEYRFDRPSTPHEIFDRLARGDVYFFDFTVTEGSNMFDIAHALESAGVMKAEEFLHAAANPSAIHDLAPRALTLEGYLFPSTYRLSHSITGEELCLKMTEQFRRQWKKLAGGKSVDVHKTVTLASLIEKETGVPAERPLIAGVFENRLKKGMRLECDPTTIYAALLDKRYRQGIHRSDLANHNPYNTYQNAGLPPGPIANPGADALRAALEPAETDYLFFVARPGGGGGHQFSSTFSAHQKATKEYRDGGRKTPKKARKAE